jgi:putative ABC transport system substrate-binding protein
VSSLASYNAVVRSLGASMRRREFITIVGGAAVWPLAARAQQDATGARIARIGILWAVGTTERSLNIGTSERSPRKSVLVDAIADLGYIEGKTAQLLQRFPDTASDVPRFARELIDNKVDVIVAVSSTGAYAAKQLTSSIPIVVVYSNDPVGTGLVESLAHPGGNVTGLSLMGGDLIAKRLALLREAVPTMSRVIFLFDPGSSNIKGELSAQQDAAKALGLQFRPIGAPTPDAIDRAFTELASDGTEGVTVASQPMMTIESARIGSTALAYRIPTVGFHPGMVRDGLLMSYGQDYAEYLRKAAVYAGKILKGTKPADLPVEQPTELKLGINLKTARALGLTVPAPLLIVADEIIE